MCIISTSCKTENNNFYLQKGDILFQDLDSSPLCDAIELVTTGYKNGNFSHIGIVIATGDQNCINADYLHENDIRILEAIPNKVVTTRLDSFLNRSFDQEGNPKVIVGRLKKQYLPAIEHAISFLKKKIGVKYDDYFLMDNNAYYCSELIYEAFKKDSIFQLQPMTFLNPENNDTLNTWKEYYKKLNAQIPQNKLGINPGKMSLSKKIDIVHYYGKPSNIED